METRTDTITKVASMRSFDNGIVLDDDDRSVVATLIPAIDAPPRPLE